LGYGERRCGFNTKHQSTNLHSNQHYTRSYCSHSPRAICTSSYCWILKILYCNPKGRRALLRIPSTVGRSVCLCWATPHTPHPTPHTLHPTPGCALPGRGLVLGGAASGSLQNPRPRNPPRERKARAASLLAWRERNPSARGGGGGGVLTSTLPTHSCTFNHMFSNSRRHLLP